MGAALVAALVVWLWPTRTVAPDRHLPVAERLSEAARASLRSQMHAHGRGVLELTSTATLLDYEGVVVAADRVLAEPRLARPLTGDATELNTSLPGRFYDLQDQLRTQLGQLRAAAVARNPEDLAAEVANVTGTCVRCHDAYRRGN